MWRLLLSNSQLGHLSTRDLHPHCTFRPFCSSTWLSTVYQHSLLCSTVVSLHLVLTTLITRLTFPLQTSQNCGVAPNLLSKAEHHFLHAHTHNENNSTLFIGIALRESTFDLSLAVILFVSLPFALTCVFYSHRNIFLHTFNFLTAHEPANISIALVLTNKK